MPALPFVTLTRMVQASPVIMLGTSKQQCHPTSPVPEKSLSPCAGQESPLSVRNTAQGGASVETEIGLHAGDCIAADKQDRFLGAGSAVFLNWKISTMEAKTAPEQAKDSANPPFLDKSHGLHTVKRFSLSISKLKIFLGALAFSFFAKGFSGSYLKSMITQIERRFEISSSIVGLIDGSFEIGNLMVLILVSYLGSRVHRPKVIAVGCLIMATGAFISVAPHFIMGLSSGCWEDHSWDYEICAEEQRCGYNYKSVAIPEGNSSTSTAACSPATPPYPDENDIETSGNATLLGCEKQRASYLWLFVLFGNILRGIGEAPIMPLGLSYIDDFAREENSAFYIGAVRSSGLFGPTFGFLLGALCANMWVDIGTVDVDSVVINPRDIRWVGAWWLGLLICGAASVLAALPFWFLPRSLPREGEEKNYKKKPSDIFTITQDSHGKMEAPMQPPLEVLSSVKGFFPSVKELLSNVIFLIFLLLNVLQFNSTVGTTTYEPKFMEQQFNISVSRAIFFIGVVLLPFAIVGMFLGSFLIKRFKMDIKGMAKFACTTFAISYALNLFYFMANCEVLQVAGLTVNYSGFVILFGVEVGGGKTPSMYLNAMYASLPKKMLGPASNSHPLLRKKSGLPAILTATVRVATGILSVETTESPT
ncbi:UNVERIFIED_CONTAM: hypothetical protein K2H54_075389 [Gekko kuhli]